MSRLKSYFGIKSEKHAKASSNDQETPSSEDETDDGGDSGGTVALEPSNPNKTSEKTASSASKKKGHGRYAADDYTGAQVVTRTLDSLSQDGPCPDTACDGRVYKKAVPGVVLRITGGSMIQATRYHLERELPVTVCNRRQAPLQEAHPWLLAAGSLIQGVDTNKLNNCVAQSPFIPFIQSNYELAKKIMGTVHAPKMYINGILVDPLSMPQINKISQHIKQKSSQ